MSGVKYCFTCWPGGPAAPPPCLRCGSTIRYFSNGLCARCHAHADAGVDSCTDCFAWGATRHRKWRCKACERWAQDRPVGACTACQRTVTLDQNGYCRLCRRQRTYITDNVWGSVEDAICHGHQLFFADMFLQIGQHTPYRSRRPSVPIVVSRPVTHRQLTLFDWPR